MGPEYIYRDFTLTRTSKNAAGLFLQALVSCRGQIRSMFSITNGYPFDKVTYISSFYRLQFVSQEDLERFELLGFKTTKVEKVNLNASS